MRISDWSSDVCSSDLLPAGRRTAGGGRVARHRAAARRDVQGRPLAQGNPGGVRFPPAVGDGQPAVALRGMGGARAAGDQIGRASGRESGCQYVELSVVAVSLKKKTK